MPNLDLARVIEEGVQQSTGIAVETAVGRAPVRLEEYSDRTTTPKCCCSRVIKCKGVDSDHRQI
jgi:hypothetical protein